MKNMEKIVLIRPQSEVTSYPNVPLGLLAVATVLNEKGYEVKIVDLILEKGNMDYLEKEIKDAFIVGIGVLTPEVPSAIAITKHIKKVSDVKVVWGGWHPTLFPQMTVEDELVDYVITHEADFTFLQLIESLKAGRKPENIEGVGYIEDGEYKYTRTVGQVDVHILPVLNYDLVEINRYIEASDVRSLPYQTSRGCPYHCTFCINKVTGNTKYRAKSADSIVTDIRSLVEKYKLKYISFVDDNLFLNRKRIKELCQGIKDADLGIEWFGECRADYFYEGFVDDTLLQLAQESGLQRLTIGVESGSLKMLKQMKKGITPDQVIKSAEYLSRFKKIIPGYSFIIGLPKETKEDLYQTIDLIKKLHGMCDQMDFGVNTLRAYPGSEMTEVLFQEGLLEKPQTLQDFATEYYKKLFYGTHSQKWHFDEKLIFRVAYHAQLGYNTYSPKFLIKNLKRLNLKYIVLAGFIYLSRFRFNYNFYLMHFDHWALNSLYKLRSAFGFLRACFKIS